MYKKEHFRISFGDTFIWQRDQTVDLFGTNCVGGGVEDSIGTKFKFDVTINWYDVQSDANYLHTTKGEVFRTVHSDNPSQLIEKKPNTDMSVISKSFDDFGLLCESDATNLQKQSLFDEQFKNKYVEWTGEVTSISESLGKYVLHVKHCPNTFTSDIMIDMKDNQKSQLLQYKEGDTITYRAKLVRYGNILGISADEGEIVSTSQNIQTTTETITEEKSTSTEDVVETLDGGDNAQPSISPSQIATDWVKALIKGSGSEEIFDYLPQEIKSKYDSYDAWNDELANMKYAWNIQGGYFQFIGVQNEIINDNTASVEVKYKATIVGYQKTVTQVYEFEKVNDKWKLKKYYELEI